MDFITLLRDAMHPETIANKRNATFDSAAGEGGGGVSDVYSDQDIALKAVTAAQVWASDDNLDSGETYADRLLGIMVGISDLNHDGEITEDEQAVVEVALNAVFDYFLSKGIPDSDAGALLNDWDEDAGDRVHDVLSLAIADNDDEAMDEVNAFVFGEEDQEAVLDATYRKRIVFRRGKKTMVSKRVSGTVRLSAKQKQSLRKAQMKSHSAGAMMRRKKSMSNRRKAGF